MVKNGRYGPYVSHAGVNATLPSDMTPDTVTLEQAIGLLEARIAKGGGKTKRPGRVKKAKGRKAAGRRPRAEGAPRCRPQAGLRQGREHAGQAAESRGRQVKARARKAKRRRVAGEAAADHYIQLESAPLWRRNVYFEQANQANTLPPLQG